MELNKITNLINYIDSEMTGIKDKILEIDRVAFQVDSKTKNIGLLGLESKKSLFIKRVRFTFNQVWQISGTKTRYSRYTC